MKICFISPEMFHWGVHGGFGYLTWTLSRELVERGFKVSVVTPRRKGQASAEVVDGVKVYGYKTYEEHPYPLNAFLSRLDSVKCYRMADADIYHSQAVSYNTYVAHRGMPERKHILTFQDPYDRKEWQRIARVIPKYGQIGHKLRVEAEIRFLRYVCNTMDEIYAQAYFLIEKARNLYGLRSDPSFLPNPVPIPENTMEKAGTPTVCFLARWDPQKRVEIFFNLAINHPSINFIAMGKSHDPAKDEELRNKYGSLPNLKLTGFVSEEEKSRILGRSWALVNTSVREALPVSFLEALAHETPIISGENPDDLTTTYGHHVKDEDYSTGLKWLIESDEWMRKGRQGRDHVREVYEMDHVVDLHVEKYVKLGE